VTTGVLTTPDVLPLAPLNNTLRTEVVTDEVAFLALEDSWGRLVAESGLDHPFLTFEWVRSWWEAFGAGNELHIVVAKENETVVGIAPLMLTRRRFHGLRLRVLEFISNVHTPRFDFLIAGDHESARRAIWDHIVAIKRRWDLLLLCQVPEESSTIVDVPILAEERGLPFAAWKSADSPYVRIEGEWSGYLAGLRSKHRTNLRRRMRRLSELGPVSMERAAQVEDLESVLHEGFALEGAAWKQENGTAISSDAAVRHFYRKIAERFAAKGWLETYFLKLGSKRIAFQFAVSYGDRAFSLKPGYDPQLAAYSPSNLLCMLFLEHLFESRKREYDFLGVEEEWKMQWAQGTRAHYWLFVFSGSLTSTLIHFAKFRMMPRLRQRKAYPAIRRMARMLRRHAVRSNDVQVV
jgi:CelD/BcsL family acetyltransferase involved in cellulose biosynthesis